MIFKIHFIIWWCYCNNFHGFAEKPLDRSTFSISSMPSFPSKKASQNEKLDFLMNTVCVLAKNQTEEKLARESGKLAFKNFSLLTFTESSDVGEYRDPRLNSLQEILQFERTLHNSGEARSQLVSLIWILLKYIAYFIFFPSIYFKVWKTE